jgi:hypothetical protein
LDLLLAFAEEIWGVGAALDITMILVYLLLPCC